MSEDSKVVQVGSYGYRHEGELARATLEAAGIDCALFVDDAGGAEAGLSFSNPARLMVRQEDFDDARFVLEDAGMT